MGHPLAIVDDNTTVDLQAAAEERKSISTGDGPVSPIEIGRVLRERYVLVDRLGSGGRGSVFKARDLYRANLSEAEQYVAIKILHATAANREELLEDLRREFYRTQALSQRNIVNVFELDRDGDVDFFTMELLEGELLGQVMERMQPLPMSRPQAWAIIREIGSGLECAHARNVVHGDLKPHNIMITHAGEVRILDFGASGPSASGTPAYACCELLEGRPPDPRDDIYAFACLTYELLAGAHPFQRRRASDARDFGIVPIRPPGLTRQQWRALTMGLSWHRARRSISVRDWLNKLNTGRAAGPLLPAHDLGSAPPKRARRPARSFGGAALGAAALLICVGIWGVVAGLAARKISSSGLAPAAVASAQPNTGPAPVRESAGPPAASVAISDVPLTGAALDTLAQTSETPSPAVNTIKRDAGRPRDPTALVNAPVISAGNYTVRAGERFAEIRVHRSSQLGSNSPFVWWTEAASAKPGIDYVHQGKAIQIFPKGKSSTSFFVKLVPKPSRTQPEVFYIAIAAAGHGAASSQVERAAVWLPVTGASDRRS
jgi:eukaryotic-like serine/threonine-protein kinase